MIVHIGPDNVVKNILVGDTIDDFLSLENPGDTFSLAPGSNLVVIGDLWFEDKKLTKPANGQFPSWVWNEDEWQWKPPVTYPTDEILENQYWFWDEDAYQADNNDPNVWVLKTETPPE
tara:strand:- start:886 stop:1239 length:354 start_codon:yes stop_codon:yes gene_type:complete